jgi:hypothetical protein
MEVLPPEYRVQIISLVVDIICYFNKNTKAANSQDLEVLKSISIISSAKK